MLEVLGRSVGGVVLIALWLSGCQEARPSPAPADQVRAIEETIGELYHSFNFDAGGEAEWELLRSLLIDGAAFVVPVGEDQSPRAIRTDEFIDGFRAWILATPERENGFHERVVHVRIDVFGKVAHAFVVFEGFVPGDSKTKTRGLDSIQLVLDGERWRVVSFMTQYASAESPIPERFEGGREP
jgi:hypothetical protein